MTSNPEPVDEAEAIRRDIERTRAELAGTVDALSDKLNVKKQAADKVTEAKAAASDKVDVAKTAVVDHQREVTIAGGVAAVLLLVVLIRRRRSR